VLDFELGIITGRASASNGIAGAAPGDWIFRSHLVIRSVGF
jgi:hypothetical protein